MGKLRFLIWIFALLIPVWSQAQSDSLQIQPSDSLKTTIRKDSVVIEGDIETTINYYAEDSIVTIVSESKIYLYGNAKVDYGDISLTATQIELNQATNEVIARGVPDSTGRLRGTPVFKQGGQNYEADSMRYNFKSQRGVISGIVTQQGEGYMQSQKGKRLADGTIYARNSQYTTCNLKHPHWYINSSKIKMVPDKQVITGPFNMVIADIPTPLGFAFGIFPFTETRRSGIIVPVYGESADRGFFLRQGGYYWAVSEYMSAEFLGEIYTNGSWGLNTRLNYIKRYRFNGNASIRFNRRFQGEDEDRNTFDDFWINWAHSPTPRGKSSFSASVNFGSSKFNVRNDFNPNNQLANNFSSSISFRTSFDIKTTTVSLGLSARQDQNSRSGVMNVTLPDLNLAVNRIYPFKRPGVTAKNFIQKINMSYSASGTARFTNANPSGSFPFKVFNPDTVNIDQNNEAPGFFEDFDRVLRQGQYGIIHRIPISTSMKFLKYFSLNPSLNYTEAWYPYKLDYTFIEEEQAVRIDTNYEFARAYSYSVAAGLTTRIYGTFQFAGKKNPNRKLQSIRHTMIPTVSFGFKPDFSDEKFGFFKNVTVATTDTTTTTRLVSRFQGFNPGSPASTGESGIISFSLQNVFEAKIKPRTDTAQVKKIKLLDNLSFNGSYNLVADSLNLSNISIGARTKLFNIIDFNFTGSLDPYIYLRTFRDDGTFIQRRVNTYAWNAGRGIGQLRNFNISLSANFTPESFKSKSKQKINQAQDKENLSPDEAQELEYIQANPELYVDFDIPWTLQASYNISYNKTGFLDARIEQQINFSGDLSLTKTWKIGFRSGYDITRKAVSFTNIDIFKDLHCWEMRFNWNPFGNFQSYNFTISVKSALLQDLKINRQRSFYDRDFF
ncbi:MAG: putative LPS assembly protein LptD [Microscillaceae bacterium]|nr:putative LPS assembly protein LptD [Microscillaceae bacterium]